MSTARWPLVLGLMLAGSDMAVAQSVVSARVDPLFGPVSSDVHFSVRLDSIPSSPEGLCIEPLVNGRSKMDELQTYIAANPDKVVIDSAQGVMDIYCPASVLGLRPNGTASVAVVVTSYAGTISRAVAESTVVTSSFGVAAGVHCD